ncbi:sensor histidine kinase [Halobaculum sp. MBLA0147]|uniref:sensor histidine kinase n=1 Tax=Halobaculum sp. MBLA0147 TaxID=3079934 RepID=UPI0035240F23
MVPDPRHETEDTTSRLEREYVALHREAAALFDAESPTAIRRATTASVAEHLGHEAVAVYRVDDGSETPCHRTDVFRRRHGLGRLGAAARTVQSVAELGVTQTVTERVPFDGAAAYCAAPTGFGEVVVCPFRNATTPGERFETHLGELASLAGAALHRLVADAGPLPAERTSGVDPTTGVDPTPDDPGRDSPTEPDRSWVATTVPERDGGDERPDRSAVLDALDRAFPDYAFLYDRKGRYVDVLLGRRDIGEASRENLVGERVDDVLAETAATAIRDAVERAIDEWDSVSVEYPMTTFGDERYFEAVVSPLQFDGRDTAVLVARDVTELRDQRERLRRRNGRLEAFTAIVCHDLKNPLNTAQGYLGLVESRLAESGAGDAVADEIETLQHALDRMEEISQGVLALAHHEDVTVETERVAVAELAEECWELAGSDAGSLIVRESVAVEADPRSLRHVFENLFANSVTHAGRDATVTVGPTADGTGFYVADDGPGIPPTERERVFEPGTTDGDGDGIGLVVVETVAAAHDWDVSVGESVDGGARFEFTGVETYVE